MHSVHLEVYVLLKIDIVLDRAFWKWDIFRTRTINLRIGDFGLEC
jgi:hypothetical protein